MLETLNRIGEQLLDGASERANLVTSPKLNNKKEKHWICPVLFDCIENKIILDQANKVLYKDSKQDEDFFYTDPENWGRRGNKCATTVENKNFTMLFESIFGKDNSDSGSFLKAIGAYDEDLLSTALATALKLASEHLQNDNSIKDPKEFLKSAELASTEEICMYYGVIRANEINNGKPTPFFELDGYEKFVTEKFGVSKGDNGIDQLTGLTSDDVKTANFQGRYNTNAVFQTTTFNFSSGFDSFKKSFQTSSKNTSQLDKASQYILNNLNTRITGVNHIIVPSFRNRDLNDFDINEIELFLNKSSDLLFKLNSLESTTEDLQADKLFWINYIAYESDGNSFKVMNHIKDVNSSYLTHIINVFNDLGIQFRTYIGGNYLFNLQSAYYLIPVKDSGKSKKNEALELFKNILEQKKIEKETLFKYFTNLILCHRFNRHAGYSNVKSKDSFDYAIKNAVTQYLALFKTLKTLNLMNMEDSNAIQELLKAYPNPEIEEFINLKSCSRNQIALFALGRALSVIGYSQELKNHSTRPILNKVNYNGMTLDDMQSLGRQLMEKGQQYQTVTTKNGNKYQTRINTEKWYDLFSKFLDGTNWKLSQQEAVFHLLAGYVFRPAKSEETKLQETSEN